MNEDIKFKRLRMEIRQRLYKLKKFENQVSNIFRLHVPSKLLYGHILLYTCKQITLIHPKTALH